MTLKDDIENQYEALLSLAKEFDQCLESPEKKSWGSPSTSIKEKCIEKFWEIRGKIEKQIAEWMQLLRKALLSVPPSERTHRIVERTDP